MSPRSVPRPWPSRSSRATPRGQHRRGRRRPVRGHSAGLRLQKLKLATAGRAGWQRQAAAAKQKAADAAAEKKAADAAAAKKAAAEAAAQKAEQARKAKEAASRAAERAEASRPPQTYPNNLDGWIRESLDIMKKHGIPGSYDGIHRNIIRESGGNPNAINNWDINAINGVPSKGLLQVIQPTFEAYHVAGTPRNITTRSPTSPPPCNYAADRYGSWTTSTAPTERLVARGPLARTPARAAPPTGCRPSASRTRYRAGCYLRMTSGSWRRRKRATRKPQIDAEDDQGGHVHAPGARPCAPTAGPCCPVVLVAG